MQPLQPGDPRRIGRFRLLGRLGAGGMGLVYLARTPGNRRAVVKVIRPEHLGDADFRARFVREVDAAQRVGGFYTAQVIDAAPDADPPWVATAYIPGPPLEEAVARHGPFPASSVQALAIGLAEGLNAIHACGLVHRDLKPANIIVAADGPRIIDFGIARPVGADAVTGAGQLVGTLAYMSPEQAEGGQVGPSSDVFSLGTVLVFAATGANPFAAGSLAETVRRLTGPTPGLAGLPGALRHLVRDCWQRDPARRPTPADILAELESGEAVWPPPGLSAPHPEPARGQRPWPTTAVLDGIRGLRGVSGATTATRRLLRATLSPAPRRDEQRPPRPQPRIPFRQRVGRPKQGYAPDPGVRKRRFRTPAVLTLVPLLIALAAGVAWVRWTHVAALDRIAERGHIAVAFLPDNRPLSWTDDGELTGYYPELTRAVFADLGLPDLDLVPVVEDEAGYENASNAVASGKADIGYQATGIGCRSSVQFAAPDVRRSISRPGQRILWYQEEARVHEWYYQMMFPPDDRSLRRAVERTMARMRSDGRLREIAAGTGISSADSAGRSGYSQAEGSASGEGCRSDWWPGLL
ncbi:ABC-type amino acid transport substrate-binding protein [Nocardiopsis mwathae]|uniref:ABC-type amino acid transport substrate-binding protein n=1 Tax=Nocardiopsis mwathae TaxID=1472723 RepID=A0A7X0D503_9ACTN|nr:serine/threonine-protein kinase [Nocardiopsis mwathae]MBB6171680.1 ABC-type amino acid transport substrate-binding protein [Nocardiopsis mwathae]